MTKMPDYNRGYRDGGQAAVTWLHARAREMNDPRAQQILNSAADRMGNDLAKGRRWGCVPGVIYPSAEELAKLARPYVSDEEIEAGAAAECVGCGCTKSVAQLRREHPGAISCCPDRAMRAPQAAEASV